MKQGCGFYSRHRDIAVFLSFLLLVSSSAVSGVLLFASKTVHAGEQNNNNLQQDDDDTATTTITITNSETTQWEKAKHSLSLIRDLVFRVGDTKDDHDHDHDDVVGGNAQKQRRRELLHKQKGLKLIGAGFGRTGTKSIEEALGNELGFRIYDLRAAMEHGHEQQWFDVTKAWKEDDDLNPMNDLLADIEDMGYSATLDTPFNYLAPAFIQLRPDAKVLWSHRDSAEKWYESFVFIILFAEQWQFGRPWKWVFPQITNWVYPIEQFLIPFHHRIGSNSSLFINIFPWYDLLKPEESPFKTDPVLKQYWIDQYNDTPRQLKEAIGCSNSGDKEQQEEEEEEKDDDDDETSCKERFLAFNVKQGWEPLLDFLNVPKDDDLRQQAFPHVNERGTLVIVTKVMHVLGAGLPIVLMLILYVLYRILRSIIAFLSPAMVHKRKTE